MLEELQKLDTSDVEALAEIKKEHDALLKLIDKATAAKEKVAAAIYERVMGDYGSRLKALDGKARPLRQKARAELAKLKALHTRLKSGLEAAQLDQSELAFRHELGELGDEEFEKRRKGAEDALAERQRDFDEADKICQRFLEVLPAEPEPQPEAPPAAVATVSQAPAPKPAKKMPPPTPDFGTIAVTAEEARALVEAAAPPPGEFATMMVPRGRLVEDRDGVEGATFILGPITTIGRTPDNNIPLDKPEVSRRHAQITMADDGFLLTDNGSNNGTLVNGDRVSKHRLADGDQIQIGTYHFVFRT